MRKMLMAVILATCGCATVRQSDAHLKINPDVGHNIYVTDVKLVTTEAGYRTFRGTLNNDYSTDREIEWRVTWFDDDGVELETLASTWNKVLVPASDCVQMRATSPLPEARDYRLHVRKLKEL